MDSYVFTPPFCSHPPSLPLISFSTLQCNPDLLQTRNPPASARGAAVITDVCSHTWLQVFLVFGSLLTVRGETSLCTQLPFHVAAQPLRTI